MKTVLFIVILSFLSSCIYNHTAITEDLGNGYFYMGDGHESQILFNENRKKDESSGLIVTEPEIIEYNYDDNYIIAKSLRGKSELYWIINKQLPIDSIRPLTEDEYKTGLQAEGIELKLERRK